MAYDAPYAFNAEQKQAFRSAITSHEGWKDFRRANGINSANFSVSEMINAALVLGIDPALYGTARASSGKTEYRAETSEYKTTYKITTNQEKETMAHDSETETPRVIVETPRVKSGSGINAIALAIEAALADAIDADQVARIVDERIALAFKAAPSIKIECSGFDGTKRETRGHIHPSFNRLLRACSVRLPNGFVPNVWVTGPAGSGKTHGGTMLAETLGLPFHIHGATAMPHEILGYKDAGGTYHRTPFREAFEHGGVLMLDEVDAWDNGVLLALNAATSNGLATFPDGVIPRHKDCVIIACANTYGLGGTADYVGRSRIDAAFLSRFVKLAWDYDAALEIALSGNEAWAQRVIFARGRARVQGLKIMITPRDSQAGAALIEAGFTWDEAANMTYLAGLSSEQRKQIEG